MRRLPGRPSVLLGVGSVVLIGIGVGAGYLASTATTSPAQVIAQAAAPKQTLLTEPVRRSIVSKTVTFDATVSPESSITVPAPAAEDGAAPMVTRVLAKTGRQVRVGDLVAEVSGRPVIIMAGRIPAYRTLKPGVVGPDVRQLQLALRAAGYLDSAADSIYGPATAAAVVKLYEHDGYDAVSVGKEQLASAERAVSDAQKAAAGAPPSKTRSTAESLARARKALIAAEASFGATVPVGEVVFAPALPAKVTDVAATVGKPPGESLLTLSSGQLVLHGSPDKVDAGQIKTGARAQILLTPQGDVAGRVTRFARGAAAPGAAEADGDGTDSVTVTVTPSKRLDPGADGSPARVIVVVASSPTSGLVVPESALSVDASGRTTVRVKRGATTTTVPVTPGFSGDGDVQVALHHKGALAEGDLVVIGVNR